MSYPCNKKQQKCQTKLSKGSKWTRKQIGGPRKLKSKKTGAKRGR